MSRGKNLQEMEVGTVQSKSAVNASASAPDPMQTMAGVSYEDLGGPDPSNYRPDDDSAKLKDAGAGLKKVSLVAAKKVAKEEYEEVEEEALETEEEYEEVEEEEVFEEEALPEINDNVDIEDDVNALLVGEELSEGFKDKAKTIFEAALKSKVIEMREAFEAHYEAKLVEEVEVLKEELIERVDSYLEYVADEWFNENVLAIEKGLKSELTESFLDGLKGLFEENYVSIPEDKYDVVENMANKLDEMETKLNEQIEKNIFLNKRLAESVADGILFDVSEGLTITQKEKLASLAESVEFESEESYREKLEVLKESYFQQAAPYRSETETLNESAQPGVDYSDAMSAYVNVLSKSVQK
jgi:hypothetical protein